MTQQTFLLALFMVFGIVLTTGLALTSSIQKARTSVAYGQTELGMPDMPSSSSAAPATDNSLSNQGLKPQQQQDQDKEIAIEDEDVAFRIRMENGKIGDSYRICAGLTGQSVENFGCDQKQWTPEIDTGRDWVGHIYVFSADDVKNTMLYACVIGDTEKKISCNYTAIPTPPAEQVMTIDWSQSSAMNLPPTFNDVQESQSDIMKRMASQSQAQVDKDNSDSEEEEEDED